MRALILAAGRGERMRQLTDTVPKPLLSAGGVPLIVRHLEKLAALGLREVAINTSHLAERFPAALGDGGRWGLRLHYLYEGPEPLETGGALLNALPWLGAGPFLVVNGDIWTDFDFTLLPSAPERHAHLVLVDNPEHHPEGDFRLTDDGRLHAGGEPRLTYAGIALYRPELLCDGRTAPSDRSRLESRPPRFPLAPLLRAAMARGQVTGQHHPGAWTDVGTPARLSELDLALRRDAQSARLTAPAPDAGTAR